MNDQESNFVTSRTQEDEMKSASEEKRQPRCVYCGHALDEVIEDQDEQISWTWNPITQEYDKDDSDGSADKPFHNCKKCEDHCETHDWAFIDYNLIDF